MHVAGTIAAADVGRGVIGVAPEAHIYAVKAFDKAGAAPASRIIAAVEWCMDHDIRIIKASFSESPPPQQSPLRVEGTAGILSFD